MKKNNEYIRFLSIGFFCLLVIFFISSLTPFKILQGFNDPASAYIYYFSKKSIKSFKIIGIAVDEHSLNRISQRWPWKRSIYAQLLKILDKEKANTIGIDFAFVGEAEDKEDDLILREAISSISSRVVLAYFFDYKKAVPVLPLPTLRDVAYSIGMVNTPQDLDGKTRRLRSYIELDSNLYYSFSVQLVASFLNKNPKEIVSLIPYLKDKTFFISFLLKPKDIIKVSFYDVLENLEGLKQRYGKDFLKDSLVLVYPEAPIFHDNQLTPLGAMPGGFLHLNGAVSILLKRLIRQENLLLLPLSIFSLILICYVLLHSGFIIGFLFTLGVLFINFWFFILLNLIGVRFDYSHLVLFCILFFSLGSFYRYIYFLTALLKIKNKATIDPLRGLFTLRYFYYRLELELKKIYLHKDLYLVGIYFESFKEAVEGIPLEKVKDIWQMVSQAISLKNSFWSVYSQEELVGCLISAHPRINSATNFLKNNLQALLSENNIKSNIRLGYLRLKREYPIRELIFVLSGELKKRQEEIVTFGDDDMINLDLYSYSKTQGSGKFLESLDKDIEERNRELLSLIEELEKEHAKTKEAFFEIITSLVNALEARDPYTQGHSQRVCNYTLIIAEKLGWTKEQKEKLTRASLLHDLGKIGVPDSILHKNGPLNEEEFDFIKKHELIGIKILQPLKDFNEILPWIMYHHERWDGKGYPHGLAGEAIPEASQIISLADVFDALTTGRDYKVAFSTEEALEEIMNNKGTEFNPKLVDVFVDVIRQKIRP
ncbi:MAG: CHASE2 domain-containing protein [Candidatus Omnitrophica bacterium]|nr:CHASE2 domain-containing protein [Candidatus Omnitrophota bacterium]